MIAEENADADVQHWLHTVGVESRCELEVLTFFHRHRITLLPAEYLARLLGYPVESVVAALDLLTTLQLLAWSPQPRGTGAYQFLVPPVLARSEALERLLALSDHRSGRLLLGEHLRRGHEAPPEELQAAQRQFLDDANADLDLIRRFCEQTSETVQ